MIFVSSLCLVWVCPIEAPWTHPIHSNVIKSSLLFSGELYANQPRARMVNGVSSPDDMSDCRSKGT